jgi:hypothetical protein
MVRIGAIQGRVPFRTGIPALIAAALIGLAACAGSASTGGSAGDGNGKDGGRITSGPAAAPTGGPASVADTVAEAPRDAAGGVATQVGPLDALIVRTGSLSLEVTELDATLLKARARIIGLGGYVSDSERTNQGEQSTALITYRIPSARWDEALDALHGLASKVVAEQTKAVEVTGQVLDLGARIDNLRATEKALQAIMAQATKISDILDVQNQLTNVRGEIEQLSTQKAHLSDQAALATLAVTYSLPVVAVTQVTQGWNLGTEIDRAVALLVQLGQGLVVAGVWLAIVGLPILLGLVLIAALALFAARRLGIGRPNTRAELPARSA